jgi:hypothetical protein
MIRDITIIHLENHIMGGNLELFNAEEAIIYLFVYQIRGLI